MGIWDWIGPTSWTKRRGWDALPPLLASSIGASSLPAERKSQALGPIATVAYGSGFWTPTTLASGSTARNGAANSAVFACLQAIATAVAEPELRVYRVGPGERVELERTPLSDLLARPNPHMTLDVLLAYVAVSLHVDGNAYWRKLRAGDSSAGNVVEIWPISASRIEPVTRNGSSDFISFYRYTSAGGRTEEIPVENVVHYRYGLDDADHRVGLSPLKRLVREISSDDQATRYADRLLANLAINGLSLEFDKDANNGNLITQADADEMKARVMAAYGGDNVGQVAVVSPGGKLVHHGFSPEQMDMKTLHRVPEERISAVLGVPAIVAGLGAGLDRSTFSNVREAREMFTEAKLLPLWRALAATITMSLVPDFAADSSVVVDFDTSEVRALADDQNAAAVRLKTLVEAGILTKEEARAEIGYEPAAAPPPPSSLPAAASRRTPFDSLRSLRASSRALPVGRKAIEDIPDRYDALRASSLPTWEEALAAFFGEQQRRVDRRLTAGADTATALVPGGESLLLADTLEPLQRSQLAAVASIVEAELGIAFQLDDPETRRFLADAGVQIVGITDTTRDAVRAALLEGQAAGEGIPELARRLRDLPAFDQARARVVARTELGHSTSTASLASYRASGVVTAVTVMDGDYDAACAAMNGRTFPLDQAPPTLQHPNCTRVFLPQVSSAEATA